jgi:hypothetical protein
MITSGHARSLMGEAMDARCANLEQQNLLVNATPEVDCIADHLALLVRAGVDPALIARIAQLTRQIATLNVQEGDSEMSLAGHLDDLASRLHDMERNGMQQAFSVKAMGDELRWALPIAYEPAGHTAADVVRAGATVNRILDGTPAAQLFTASMRKELRDTNYGRLVELHAARFTSEGERAA